MQAIIKGRARLLGDNINTDLMLLGEFYMVMEEEQARAVFSVNRSG